MRVCSVPGCPQLYPKDEGSRCARHRAQADRRRGTAHERGYASRGHQHFRDTILTRDPICTVPGCINLSTIADHYPRSRRELVDLGLNPNDPQYGRALCKMHHDQSTAANEPGGWNQR